MIKIISIIILFVCAKSMMQLFVDYQGETVSIELSSSAAVEDVLTVWAALSPLNQQVIGELDVQFAGDILLDQETPLCELGICSEAVLNLITAENRLR